jgi:hypothetical protein
MVGHLSGRQKHLLVLSNQLLGGISHSQKKDARNEAIPGIVDGDGPSVIDFEGIFLWEQVKVREIEAANRQVVPLDT